MIAHLFNLSGQDHLPQPCFLIGNNDVLVKFYESEMIQSGVVGCFNFVFLKKKLPTTPLCQILTNILSFDPGPVKGTSIFCRVPIGKSETGFLQCSFKTGFNIH